MEKRIYYFDNLKFLLIFLVVLGHLLSPLKSNHIIKVIYTFIYSFHMPAFLFVSGYFLNKEKFSKNQDTTVLDSIFSNTNITKYILI